MDGRAPSEDHTISLAKALSSALVVRGAQLSVVRRLESEYVVDIHSSSVSWVVKKIAQYEANGNKQSRNSALEFFKVLMPLLLSVNKADASAM